MKPNKFFLIICILILQNYILYSQNIPATRITDWKNPGSLPAFSFQNSVNLTSFGADSTGSVASDSALQLAINALIGPGEIFVTKGTYLFKNTIALQDSIIIQGETDTVFQKPLVLFKLSPGNNKHGIQLNGSEINTNYTLTYPLNQGDKKLYVNQPQLFGKGDFIKLYANDDSLLVYSSWAYHTTGQIFEVMQIEGDTLVLNKPLRRSYSGIKLPVIYKITPCRQVHIKCIKIERLDSTSSQSANIYMNMTADCSVSGIESYNCNFAHIDIRNSSRITVENSFFKDALSYGSDGKGYGVMLQSTTGDCFVHQNNFEHLRHSMIMQSGANGNVFAYNYSCNPYWTGTSLPSNSSGDLVFHGNYVYMNLLEGNVVQNIVIDNSHGINGPYNTFYRNRAELYGIFMNNNPASNGQNFIGNQVSNTTSIFLGFYSLQGTNHFEYGNSILGTVTPSTSAEPTDTTMFGYSFNSFYQNIAVIPPINNNNWYFQTPFTEANYRYAVSDKKAICSDVFYPQSTINIAKLYVYDEYNIYPNPFNNTLNVLCKNDARSYVVKIYNMLGKMMYSQIMKGPKNIINTEKLNSGMYFVEIEGLEKQVFKIIKY